MKTYQIKQKEVRRESHELDAAEFPLGRLASRVAVLLMGKHKASYTAHIDTGDSVIIKNASKLVLTGKKAAQKVYQKHSNYPGGFKEVAVARLIKKQPEKVVELAILRMLPKNRLQAPRMRRLTITK
jgi:large subunit ribosomal protein L13